MPGYPCRVLIVDDDSACLDEYSEFVGNLGYDCVTADSATTALRAIAADRLIGIVMTDLRMPGMDGLSLLEELSERFMSVRPMVAVVVTGDSTLDSAVSAMRSNAIDFLTKPVSLEGLSLALRRAASRWVRLAAQHRLGAGSPEAASQADWRDDDKLRPSRSRGPGHLQEFAATIMKNRQARIKFFPPELLAAPTWDILLDLAVAGLKGEKVPTSSACASTNVPLSTALRHVNQLVEAGLVKRELDASDRRRTLLELEPHALELMTSYLASTWETIDPRTTR